MGKTSCQRRAKHAKLYSDDTRIAIICKFSKRINMQNSTQAIIIDSLNDLTQTVARLEWRTMIITQTLLSFFHGESKMDDHGQMLTHYLHQPHSLSNSHILESRNQNQKQFLDNLIHSAIHTIWNQEIKIRNSFWITEYLFVIIHPYLDYDGILLSETERKR